MTDTPRTKELKDLRQKRLAFFEKKAETSSYEPVGKNGMKSSRIEKTLRQSMASERFENSGFQNASGKLNSKERKPGQNTGYLGDSSCPGGSFLASRSRSSHDIRSSNDSNINKSENGLERIGLIEKGTKKTPRDENMALSGRKSTKKSPMYEVKLLDDAFLKRSLPENDIAKVEGTKSLSSSVSSNGNTVSEKTARKAGPMSQNEKDKRKSLNVSQDEIIGTLNDKKPGISMHLKEESLSDSTSSKKLAKQGSETFRIMGNEPPEKSGVTEESDLVAFSPVPSRWPTVTPSLSRCFDPSSIKLKDVALHTDRKKSLTPNLESNKTQQMECKDVAGKAASCSFPAQNGLPFNSVTLEDDDHGLLFKSSRFSVGNQDLKTGNSFGTTSSLDKERLDEAGTQSRHLPKLLMKSSVPLQMGQNENSGDRELGTGPRELDTFSSSSTMKSVAADKHVDDAVKVSEKTEELSVQQLPKALHPSGLEDRTERDLHPTPSESVEFRVPDFLKDIPKVSAVKRSQISSTENNDFLSSSDVELKSEVLSSETLVSTLASTLNFGSVNLELVLGKHRMERLLKNILEIDGSSTISLKDSTITDISLSKNSCDVLGNLKVQPQDLKDSSMFECRNSQDTDNLCGAFNVAQASCESLGLKTHRPSAGSDDSRSLVSLRSSSPSSIRGKNEKLKCSFLVDEIYAEARMLKGGQSHRSRSDVATMTEHDTMTDVRNELKSPPVPAEVPQKTDDFRGVCVKPLSEKVSEMKDCAIKPPGTCVSQNRELLAESKRRLELFEKKKRHYRKETLKQEAASADSKEENRGIRRNVQQQWNEERERPEGFAENDSAQDNCYMNPAIDRYFKSIENLSFKEESLLPKVPLENSLEGGLELGVVGRSLKKAEEDTATAAAEDGFQQKLKDMKKDLFQAIDHNSDTLFSKVASAVDVVGKDGEIEKEVSAASDLLESSLGHERQQLEARKIKQNDGYVKSLSSSSESQVGNTAAKVSCQEPLLSASTKAKREEKRLNHDHGDNEKTSEKMPSSNSVSSGCSTTSVWKSDQPPTDEQIHGTLEVSSSSSSCGVKQGVKKPAFAPIVNVCDSEEFEYSDLGRRGVGSFGEFFRDEMSINLRDSGDGEAVGRSRNSSMFPQPKLKGIVEDCAMDSVSFDYTVENKVNLSEELKATLCLNLGDSSDAESEQPRKGNKEISDMHETKEDKGQEKKASKVGSLRKSSSRSPERQQVDPARDVPQKPQQEENVPAVKSWQAQNSNAEAAEDSAAKNDVYYRDLVHHLVNDSRFKKIRPKSSGTYFAPHVPKLPLSDDASFLSKSVSRPPTKTPKVSSSKLRPVSSLSSVLGKARVAWKDEDPFADVSASIQAVPALRQRPWSAKVMPRSSFQDDSGIVFDRSSTTLELSRSVGDAVFIGRKRPSSVGPRSRRRLTSMDVEFGQSDEDVGSRHVKEQIRSNALSTVAQSVQINKAKGQSRKLYRFATEDYEKYSALSPRIQAGELSMLTSFPDEILLKIFSNLSRSDLSRCGRVCQHFFRVAMDSSLWRRIELEEQALTDKHLAAIGRKRPASLVLLQCTGEQVTSNGLRQLFWECSESLRELSFSGCSKGHLTGENILLHATNRCRNITHLDGSWTNLSSQGIIAFSEESEHLVSVCLNGCQSINDEAVQTLVARHGRHLVMLELLGLFGLTNVTVETVGNCCKNLVTLTLGQCWKLTDSCLAQLSINMPQLENLDLRGCKQIKDQTIHQLVKNCGQLTSLSLANCPNLTDSSLAEIAVQCPQLRSLDVCGCSKLTNVGVKTLVSGCNLFEYLDISSTSINHRSVTAIASYCSRRLEVLKLNFCKQMNMESLVRLVKNCKRLKKLYVYGVKGLHNVEELKMLNPNIWIEM